VSSKPAIIVVVLIYAFADGLVASPLFGDRVDYGGFIGPQGIVAADFDGDGDVDLAVANQGTIGNIQKTVVIMLNAGNGAFSRADEDTTGYGPSALCAADLDGDGDIDLAVANRLGDDMAVLRNNGHAVFSLWGAYPTGQVPFGICAADFDRDGDVDLAVSNSLSPSVSVFKNAGNGIFSPKTDYVVSEAALALCADDFDNDGDADLAVAISYGVEIFLNRGDGRFVAPVLYNAGQAYGIAAGDFDGDGFSDLAAARLLHDSVVLLMNQHDGTFGDFAYVAMREPPNDVVAVDFDHDHDLDFAVTHDELGQAAVMLNDGAGLFVMDETYEAGDRTASICAGDFDGDGDNDFAVTNPGSNDVTVYFNRTYTAKADIEPDSMDWLYGYATDPIAGAIYVGEFAGGYGVYNIDALSVKVNDSLFPSSFTIINDHPDIAGDVVKMEMDVRQFVRGYGVLWDTAAYVYTVSGQMTDGTPFAAGGDVTIFGFRAGDINNNGAVEIGDAVTIISYLYRQGQLSIPAEAADLNLNGQVDLGDAVYIIDYIFRYGPAPGGRK